MTAFFGAAGAGPDRDKAGARPPAWFGVFRKPAAHMVSPGPFASSPDDALHGVAMSLAEKTDDRRAAVTSGLGADLRALRKSRHMTLQQVALAVGRSVGWLSQIERGLTEPSLTDLRKLGKLYEVPLSLLFRNEPGPDAERAHIVRAAGRRRLGSIDDGFVEELLSPDLGGAFEIFRSEFAPGSALPEPLYRETEEAGYLLSGTLDMMIGERWHTLQAGDSFRFRHEAYQWRNRGSEPAVVIWVVAPPIY